MTARIDDNVLQVRDVTKSDHRLTVRLIGCLLTYKFKSPNSS